MAANATPPPSFFQPGNAQQTGNDLDLTKLEGYGNQGSVTNTGFAILSATRSVLQINECDYTNIDVHSSSLRMEGSSYGHVHGTNLTLVANRCAYMKVKGADGSHLDCDNSSYFSWTGSSGQGLVKRDMYTTINGTGNVVDLSSNNSLKVIGDRNKVEASGTSHLEIEGEDNDVKSFKEDSHTTVKGSKNEVNLETNRDLKVAGNGNHVTAKETLKFIVEGDDNHVQALESTFVTVSGNKNRVIVKGVAGDGLTHFIERSLRPGKTVLELRPGITNLDTSCSHFRLGMVVNLSYVGELRIHQNEYTSGLFRFRVDRLVNKRKCGAGAEVTILKLSVLDFKTDPEEQEDGSRSVTIYGKMWDKVEELQIKGRKVERVEGNDWKFMVYYAL